MTDCYAYCRVSSSTQAADDKDGLPRQRLSIQKYADTHGLNIVAWFEDAYTGTEMDRPKFKEMRDLITSNGVRTVVCECLNRLSRDMVLQEIIIKDFQKNAIELISIAEPDIYTTDPTRVLFRRILGAVIEYEKIMSIGRMNSAKKRIRDSGKPCGGRSAYGEHRKLPEEKRIVDHVFHLRKQGYNAVRISDTLNGEGITTRSGGRWFPAQINRILKRAARPIPKAVAWNLVAR